jgi:hypothetical protein
MDWRTFSKRLILVNGRVDEFETGLVKKAMLADDQFSQDEVAFLLELKREAQSVHPDFQRFVNDVLRMAILRDRKIDKPETAWLRNLIFNDRLISPDELKLLHDLERDAAAVCPEFVELLKECDAAGVHLYAR